MSAKSLYEEDFHAWALEQARVLRELRPGAPLPNELDLQRVAEEVEDLGNEQRFQVEGNLVQALIHLTKVVVLPEDEAVRHWLKKVNAFLAHAQDRYSRSMARAIDMDTLWNKARRRLAGEFAVDGLPPPDLPEACPFSLSDLLAEGAKPTDLAARLRVALAPASP
jgi:hypothetical protein